MGVEMEVRSKERNAGYGGRTPAAEHSAPGPIDIQQCWRVHDKYLCSSDKKHFEECHVYYQKCNSCPHDRAHCGNLIMEREASKLFPWRCNVCAQKEFMDTTGRYKTEGKPSSSDQTIFVF
ncbi:hypothetical protein BGZ68_009730 [Mortierella alpina]|nr:hypothetical protein BGZ68_009730 [Mortierella alpina]